jgi:hypothetical protein
VASYRLQAEIGRGALGRVVRVVDLEDGRVYAGKLLHESFRDDPRAVERFSGEARLLASLAHDNVVRVHELALIEGREVIIMELVEGPSLQTVLAREGPLPQQRIIRIARGIARGLQASHHLGLVHRDLKPANILLAPGEVAKLVDFGLARTTSLIGVDRAAFALVGTPDYMAPESVDPLAADSRSDLYALGCVLFEMTAGRPPHDGASPFAVLEAHQRAPVPTLPPTPERTPGLIALIGALLAKSPADRPQSAAAVVERLDALEQGGALLVADEGPALGQSACTRCGAPVVEEVGICFHCGVPTAGLDPGRFCLLVVGPGRVAEKLDARFRQALVDWLLWHPQLGLAPEPLASKVPRLPFLLTSGISEETALLLAESLRGIGLVAEVCKGGPMAHPAMRSKMWKISGRVVAVGAAGGGGAFQLFKHLSFTAMFGTGIAMMMGVFISGWRMATRPVTQRLAPPRPVSPALARVLKTVAESVPTIGAHRHRDSLRGVLARLLALEKTLGGCDSDLAQEVAGLALSATHATLWLDQLEDALLAVDLRNPDAAARARLQERDRLATRLLETAARLDSLRVRLALTDARQRAHAADQTLGELRFQVEALEEIAEVSRR